ncbi:hypothetical protein EJ05DRAFT_512687 [Pseudovirgaria hyperparasitica]|uniref:Membrane-associated proteins in eicosanoid and glutathione metabolism n=1 Tax=Pseudovirgaria hyperparasitica TaxID=470096 RepID=A0A6A6VZP1_9PEZI|nr:uncharacterized protein EJ05DRAFT_512687 [Pseudovirgaria hyperparasitica]KAF2756138.1 hypothetical protein EJ05DRAFT_512687 [Pseudovirgaria hyperparasitica]
MASNNNNSISPLIKPLATLAGWTFVQQIWMHTTRIQAIGRYNISMDPSINDAELATKVPIEYRRVANNYNHLHEQPTVFYAVTLALALVRDDSVYTLAGVWGYVAVRVVHSLYQSLANRIMTRFRIFAAGSVVLGALTGRLAVLAFA